MADTMELFKCNFGVVVKCVMEIILFIRVDQIACQTPHQIMMSILTSLMVGHAVAHFLSCLMHGSPKASFDVSWVQQTCIRCRTNTLIGSMRMLELARIRRNEDIKRAREN